MREEGFFHLTCLAFFLRCCNAKLTLSETAALLLGVLVTAMKRLFLKLLVADGLLFADFYTCLRKIEPFS